MFFVPFGRHIDTAIGLVPYKAGNVQRVGLFLCGSAEKNTLDETGYFYSEMLFHLRKKLCGFHEGGSHHPDATATSKDIIRAEECRFAVADNVADHLLV